MIFRSFKIGGIHPPENKIGKESAIEPAPLPNRVAVHLAQHLGAPAKPVVANGAVVKVGTLIAEPGGFVSAPIHSPVSGTVTGIEEVMTPGGYKKPAIIITREGDEWEESIDRSATLIKEIKCSPKEVVETMASMGIVGMGGAGFPTAVKFSPPENKKIEWLLINGVECEPFLTADHRLMLEKADEILVGISLMKHALGIEKAVIGIEANKPDAIAVLTKNVKNFKGITVQPLKVKYPQGAEKQLIFALTGQELASGKLPMDYGCVVDNVGTAFAVYEAVQKRKPLIERVVTVAGIQLPKSVNLLTRIGTSIEDLLAAAGGLPENSGKVISGGPMMGKAIGTLEVPIAKGSSGITILPAEMSRRSEPDNCIRCARCVKACPMGLEPYLLEKMAEQKHFLSCEEEDAADCIECGSCSFVCPSSRPLLDFIRLGKAEVMKIRRERSAK